MKKKKIIWMQKESGYKKTCTTFATYFNDMNEKFNIEN